MSLTNWKINPISAFSANYIVSSSAGVKTFAITDTKLYVAVVTLKITQDYTKLPQ